MSAPTPEVSPLSGFDQIAAAMDHINSQHYRSLVVARRVIPTLSAQMPPDGGRIEAQFSLAPRHPIHDVGKLNGLLGFVLEHIPEVEPDGVTEAAYKANDKQVGFLYLPGFWVTDVIGRITSKEEVTLDLDVDQQETKLPIKDLVCKSTVQLDVKYRTGVLIYPSANDAVREHEGETHLSYYRWNRIAGHKRNMRELSISQERYDRKRQQAAATTVDATE